MEEEEGVENIEGGWVRLKGHGGEGRQRTELYVGEGSVRRAVICAKIKGMHVHIQKNLSGH